MQDGGDRHLEFAISSTSTKFSLFTELSDIENTFATKFWHCEQSAANRLPAISQLSTFVVMLGW